MLFVGALVTQKYTELSFKKYFKRIDKNNKTIHLYCFNQCFKYLCKNISLWIYPLKSL